MKLTELERKIGLMTFCKLPMGQILAELTDDERKQVYDAGIRAKFAERLAVGVAARAK